MNKTVNKEFLEKISIKLQKALNNIKLDDINIYVTFDNNKIFITFESTDNSYKNKVELEKTNDHSTNPIKFRNALGRDFRETIPSNVGNNSTSKKIKELCEEFLETKLDEVVDSFEIEDYGTYSIEECKKYHELVEQ